MIKWLIQIEWKSGCWEKLLKNIYLKKLSGDKRNNFRIPLVRNGFKRWKNMQRRAGIKMKVIGIFKNLKNISHFQLTTGSWSKISRGYPFVRKTLFWKRFLAWISGDFGDKRKHLFRGFPLNSGQKQAKSFKITIFF